MIAFYFLTVAYIVYLAYNKKIENETVASVLDKAYFFGNTNTVLDEISWPKNTSLNLLTFP